MTLSKEQIQAINHNEGPLMVLAGPGSGKTLVITHRTKNLIEQYGVNPNRILVITFTKAAATQMKERFDILTGKNYSAVNFGTFHSVFFTILRYAYKYTIDNIIKEDDRYRFLQAMVEKYKIDIEDEKEFIEGLSGEISLVKGEMMDVSNYYSTGCSDEVFRNIYKDYCDMLKAKRLIDFDDMLIQTYELLTKYPNILSAWREHFEYILIDEFQDINRVQYEIIKLLTAPKNNLFIVGDDDQSIYKFRGARPEIMLNFSKDYENTKVVYLSANYRCSGNIVENAARVIKNNKKRYSKNIYTDNLAGDLLDIKEFNTVSQENKSVIDEIRKLAVAGCKLSEIAVLYRTNTQPRAILEKMMEYNIPFKIKDSIPSIYDHWITKDIFTYIEMANIYKTTKVFDRGIFLRVANKPNRYIGRDALGEKNITFRHLYEFYSSKQWMIERLSKLEYDLKLIADMNPFAAISYIRNSIGYQEYLEDYAVYRKMKVEELLEILDELMEISKEFESIDKWNIHIQKLKEDLENKKNKEKKNVPSVTMATFHGAKGLEFDNVFIIDANEGITPHNKSIKEEDIEEERRMFYVAMTRARKKLYIYYSKERYNKELTASRFLGEIFVDKDSIVAGAQIEHKIYGKGKIISIDSGRIKVKFDKIAMAKVLDVDFCISNRMISIYG